MIQFLIFMGISAISISVFQIFSPRKKSPKFKVGDKLTLDNGNEFVVEQYYEIINVGKSHYHLKRPWFPFKEKEEKISFIDMLYKVM